MRHNNPCAELSTNPQRRGRLIEEAEMSHAILQNVSARKVI